MLATSLLVIITIFLGFKMKETILATGNTLILHISINTVNYYYCYD